MLASSVRCADPIRRAEFEAILSSRPCMLRGRQETCDLEIDQALDNISPYRYDPSTPPLFHSRPVLTRIARRTWGILPVETVDAPLLNEPLETLSDSEELRERSIPWLVDTDDIISDDGLLFGRGGPYSLDVVREKLLPELVHLVSDPHLQAEDRRRALRALRLIRGEFSLENRTTKSLRVVLRWARRTHKELRKRHRERVPKPVFRELPASVLPDLLLASDLSRRRAA